MNIDFHYYGTYSAARISGFSHEDSCKIAWAAETVDENNLVNIYKTKTYKEESKKDFDKRDVRIISTFEKTSENSNDSIRYWRKNPNNENIARIRSVWLAFHFLPGNFKAAAPADGIIEHEGTKETADVLNIFTEYEKYDELDMQLLCRNNSNTSRIMIGSARQQYQEYLEKEKDAGLYAIGVAMHVLADTWAHEFFTGSPNYWTNDAEGFRVKASAMKRILIDHDKIEKYFSGTVSGVQDNSIFYMGHGRAGHCPDYDFLEYYYVPRWKKEKKEFGYAKLINNPNRFQNAFAQMIDAMKYIRGEMDEFPLREYNLVRDKSVYADNSDIAAVKEEIFLQPCSGVYYNEVESQRCELWKKFIKNKWNIVLDNYVYNNGYDDELSLKQFWRVARKHRDRVLTYVSDQTDYNFDNKIADTVDKMIDDYSSKFSDLYDPALSRLLDVTEVIL